MRLLYLSPETCLEIVLTPCSKYPVVSPSQMLRHMSQTVVSCSAATTTIPLSSIYNNITAAAYQPHANPIFVVPPFPWSDLGTETTRLRFFMSLQF